MSHCITHMACNMGQSNGPNRGKLTRFMLDHSISAYPNLGQLHSLWVNLAYFSEVVLDVFTKTTYCSCVLFTCLHQQWNEIGKNWQKPKIGCFRLKIWPPRWREGKSWSRLAWKKILCSFRKSNQIFRSYSRSYAMVQSLNTTFWSKKRYWATLQLTFGIIELESSIMWLILYCEARTDIPTKC